MRVILVLEDFLLLELLLLLNLLDYCGVHLSGIVFLLLILKLLLWDLLDGIKSLELLLFLIGILIV